MSVFWKIKLDDGRDGYQVMDDDLNNAHLIDDQCVPLRVLLVTHLLRWQPPPLVG